MPSCSIAPPTSETSPNALRRRHLLLERVYLDFRVEHYRHQFREAPTAAASTSATASMVRIYTIAANTAGLTGAGLVGVTFDLRLHRLRKQTPHLRLDVPLRVGGTALQILLPPSSPRPRNDGGPTQTMPPLTGSPAIDPLSGTSSLTNDQRGFPRPRSQGHRSRRVSESRRHSHRLPCLGYRYRRRRPALRHGAFSTAPSHSRPMPQALSPSAVPCSIPRAIGLLPFSCDTRPGLSGNRASWRLMRSPNLAPGSFTEVFRLDGHGAIPPAPGVSFELNVDSPFPFTRFTITDTNPSPGGAFYRFEAVLTP